MFGASAMKKRRPKKPRPPSKYSTTFRFLPLADHSCEPTHAVLALAALRRQLLVRCFSSLFESDFLGQDSLYWIAVGTSIPISENDCIVSGWYVLKDKRNHSADKGSSCGNMT